MSENTKTVQDIKPLSDQEKAQAFVKSYEEICELHQMRVVANPAWKMRDDGTYSMVVQMSVGKLPKQE